MGKEISIGTPVEICAFREGGVSPAEYAKRKSGRYISWAEVDGCVGVVRGKAVESAIVDVDSKDAARKGPITVPLGALKPQKEGSRDA